MKNIDEILNDYPYAAEKLDSLKGTIEAMRLSSEAYLNDPEALQTMFNSIDLTTLSATDSAESVKAFVAHICSWVWRAPVSKITFRRASAHASLMATSSSYTN